MYCGWFVSWAGVMCQQSQGIVKDSGGGWISLELVCLPQTGGW